MRAVEQAKNLNYIVFDKTGTLTKGEFAVTEIIAFEGADEEEVLRLAAAIDANSLHPIARAVVAEAKKKEVNAQDLEKIKNCTIKRWDEAYILPAKGKNKLCYVRKDIAQGNPLLPVILWEI